MRLALFSLLMMPFVLGCSKSSESSEEGNWGNQTSSVSPPGEANYRTECEAFTATHLSKAVYPASRESEVIPEFIEQCSTLPTQTTCEQCRIEIDRILIMNWSYTTDCACINEQNRGLIPGETESDTGVYDPICPSILEDWREQSPIRLKDWCQTCPSAPNGGVERPF